MYSTLEGSDLMVEGLDFDQDILLEYLTRSSSKSINVFEIDLAFPPFEKPEYTIVSILKSEQVHKSVEDSRMVEDNSDHNTHNKRCYNFPNVSFRKVLIHSYYFNKI